MAANFPGSDLKKSSERLSYFCQHSLNLKTLDEPVERHVILFKSFGSGTQSYKNMGLAANYAISIFPVMDYEFTNRNYLGDALRNPNCYRGIIFTSPRAVQAVELALNTIEDKSSFVAVWAEKRNFAVGNETKASATCLGIPTTGHQTGNAKNLAHFISSTAEKTSDKSFLYPCSEIRRDTLKDNLHGASISIEEIPVYKPISRIIGKNWIIVQKSIQELKVFQGVEKVEQILVFFSPSSVQIVIDDLRSGGFQLSDYRVIAIGPTTAEYILHNYGIEAVLCDEPSAPGLKRAIESMFHDSAL